MAVHASSKPKHIAHAIKASRPPNQPLCGPQGAACEDQPVSGAMGHFNALAQAAANVAGIYDDVPGSDTAKPMLPGLRGIEIGVPVEDGEVCEHTARALRPRPPPRASAVPEGASRFIR